jgi:hypothetical protein
MTAYDGLPREMEPFALDSSTAEGLVTGVVDAGDAPPEYRAVARTLQALREAADSPELFGEPAAVERIAAAVVLERRARPGRHSSGFSSRAARLAAAVVVAGGIFLSGGLASVGSLPEPAQDFASAVLDKVGISVPTGGEDPTVVDAPPTTSSSPAPTGAGAPEPDVATPPDLPSATAPGNGQGDAGGAKADGAPPNTAKADGNGKSPNGPPPATNGNGRHP